AGGRARPDRRLHPSRPFPRVRRVVARNDAPPPRHAEWADGVPDRRGDRLGARARGERAVAQLRRVRKGAQRDARSTSAPAAAARGAPALRPFLPARPAPQLQPQVLPRVAPALRLLRTMDGRAPRRAGVSPRRKAVDAARPLGSGRGPGGGVIAAVLGAAAALATPATPAVSMRPYASGFSSPTYVASNRAEPNRLYVVEQPGRIRYLVRGRLAGTFLDIRSRVLSGGERGLLSVAFSPGDGKKHRFYVDYTDRNSG